MSAMSEFDGDVEEPQVREKDLEVLKSFDDDQDLSLAFQGLKRKLGFHAETLTRSLRRLERDSLLERTGDGYRLTGKGIDFVGSKRDAPNGEMLQIFHTYLPDVAVSQALLVNLRSKWFGSLRWLGSFTKGEKVVMSWISEQGTNQINVMFQNSFISVEAVIDNPSQKELAVRSAYELVSQIAKAYSDGGSPPMTIHPLRFRDQNAS
jgi:DNA-binding Lrp family transcriptional regulator